MIAIETYTSTKFKLDGIPYLKNYISEVAGNQITIFNAYDRKDVRSNWLHYSEITLDGVVYGNVSDLQNALLPVIYTRASLGGATASFDLTVYEEGETPISNVNEIEVIGATVTDDGGGKVTLEVTGGGGTPTLQEVTDEGNTVTDGTSTTTIGQGIIEIDNDEFECVIFYNNGDVTGIIMNSSSGVAYETANASTSEVTFYRNGDINYKPNVSDPPITLNIPYTDETDGNTFATREWAVANITGGSTVNSVNGQTSVVILNTDDIDESATRFWLTSALKTAYDGAVTWVTNSNANIRATVLTGISFATSTAVLATDTILQAIGKLQAQINNRLKYVVKDNTPSTALTGTTTETIISSYLIPANTFNATDALRIPSLAITKSGTAGVVTIRVKLNTTNSLSGANTILIQQNSSTIVWQKAAKDYMITGGLLYGHALSTNVTSGIDTGSSSSSAIASISFNPAVDNYIIVSGQLTNSGDSVQQVQFLVTN